MRIEQKGENMKKLLLILPVMALSACNQQPQTLVSGCEKIVANENGDVYKCPMSEELAAIQAMEANAVFEAVEGLDMATVAADAENVYVRVSNTTKCEVEGQIAYWVVVKNPALDGKKMNTVVTCK